MVTGMKKQKKTTGRGGARAGAGRPALAEAKATPIGVRFPPDLRDYVEHRAADWRVTPSEAVRRLVALAAGKD